MNTVEPKAREESLVIFLVFLLLILLCLHQIIDVDIWWHLKTAEWMLSAGAIPRVDVFSFTSAGHPWINLHWLYQLISHAAFRLGGAAGIVTLKVVVLTITFGMLFRIGSSKGHRIQACGWMLLGLLAFDRFLPRPEIFSEFFVALFLWCIYRYRQGRARVLYVLPLLQVLWVNMEGLFILGPIIVAALLLADWFQASSKRYFNGGPVEGFCAGHYRRRLLVVGLTIAACFLSPYGLRGLLFPLTLLTRLGAGREVFSATIAELTPPPFPSLSLAHMPFFFFNILAMGSAASFLLNAKRTDVFRLLTWGLFLILSLLARRNIPLFVCVAFPAAALNTAEFAEQIRPEVPTGIAMWAHRIGRAFAWALSAILIGLVLFVAGNKFSQRAWPLAEFGAGFSPFMYPVKAADFVEQHNLAGRGFNNIGIGGYLIWRGGGARCVFIDGRLEVHGREFYTEYIRVLQAPRFWEELASKYDIEYVILQYTMGDTLSLIQHLHDSSGWALVYFDETTCIYVKRGGANQSIIELCESSVKQGLAHAEREGMGIRRRQPAGSSAPWHSTIPFGLIHRGVFLSVVGYHHAAVAALEGALACRPDVAVVHYNLSIARERQGDFQGALDSARKAVRVGPSNADAWGHLGRLEQKAGRYDEADRCFCMALKVDRRFSKARYDLALLRLTEKRYGEAVTGLETLVSNGASDARIHVALALAHMGLGNAVRAEAECRIALSLDPMHLDAHNTHGLALRHLGRREEAVSAYKRAIALAPTDFTAHNNIGICYAESGDHQRARLSWQHALGLQPTNAGVRANLRRLEFLQGEADAFGVDAGIR